MTAHTTASKKAKGARLEKKVASEMRHKLGIDAVRMPLSGAGSLKGDVYNKYFSIECKNKETHNVWNEWEQARSQVQFNKPPVLAISGNHRPILMVMDLNDWLDLVKQAYFEK